MKQHRDNDPPPKLDQSSMFCLRMAQSPALQQCEMCLSAMRFAGIKRVISGATQAKVAPKYFVFPNLSLADFQNAGETFEAIGGQFEEELLPLYIDGQE